MVRLLLGVGACLNQCSPHGGYIYLEYAMSEGCDAEVIMELLSVCADASAGSHLFQLTALGYARRSRDIENCFAYIDALLKGGADINQYARSNAPFYSERYTPLTALLACNRELFSFFELDLLLGGGADVYPPPPPLRKHHLA